MTSKEIRGVFCTLQRLCNNSKFDPTIIEDRPIGYWMGMISGYMVASIMTNNNFNEDLSDCAPIITEMMYECERQTMTMTPITDKEDNHD